MKLGLGMFGHFSFFVLVWGNFVASAVVVVDDCRHWPSTCVHIYL